MSDLFLATAFTDIGAAATPPAPRLAAQTLVSLDGKSWARLGKTPTIPQDSLENTALLYRNGTWWMLGIVMAEVGVTVPDYFYLYRSLDCLTWSVAQRVDTGAGVYATWPQSWFVDPADDSVHLLTSISKAPGLSPQPCYEMHPTNADMTAWSAPVEITGTGFPTRWWDPHMVKIGATYYLWSSNAGSNVELASSSTPFSGYTGVGTGDWTGLYAVGAAETPCPVLLDNGHWRVYSMHPTGNEGPSFGETWYVETADPTFASGWTAPAKAVGLDRMSHMTVVRVPGITAASFVPGFTLADGLTGTGKVGSPAGNGNRDVYIAADGNPTDAGYAYLGSRLAFAIRAPSTGLDY